MSTFVVELSSYVFDGAHPSMYRDRLGAVHDRCDSYDDRYDFHTLCYDVFWRSELREVWMLGPRLLNFVSLLKGATFMLDDRSARVAVENISRSSLIRLSAATDKPERLCVTHPKFTLDLPVQGDHLAAFAGKNAVFSINKNNRLEWIQDWLTYYHKAHGANAAVLVDNGSTDYSLQDLRDSFNSVDGYDIACVIPAPFPFGPKAENKANTDSLYLQRSMSELIRRRILGQARAALNVDIDELIHSKTGQSVFDATVESPLGYLRTDARWVYADPQLDPAQIRHASHGFISTSGRPRANRKWCVAPQGPFGDHQWLTHFINNRKDPSHPDFEMLHFRQVSTNWKMDRTASDRDQLTPFPELQALMQRYF